MSRRPSRVILTPSSRRMVAGLLIAAGILLVIAQLIRLYILVVSWRALGVAGGIGPAVGIGLGLGAGVLTSYIGWRVGRAGTSPR